MFNLCSVLPNRNTFVREVHNRVKRAGRNELVEFLGCSGYAAAAWLLESTEN